MEGASGSIGCTFADLQKLMKRKGLKKSLKYIRKNKPVIKQITKKFDKMITGIIYWEMDRVHAMLAALSVLALVEEGDEDPQLTQRSSLIQRFLVFVDCLSPMKVHEMMERLIEELDSMNLSSDANLLYLAVVMANSCAEARPLAVCMLWQLLARRLPGIEITMHRYRELSELTHGIAMNRPEMPEVIQMEDDADADLMEQIVADVEFGKAKLLVLLKAMDHLLRLILDTDNKNLKDFGYPDHFFVLELKDAEFLYLLCLELVSKVPDDDDALHNKIHYVLCSLSEVLVKTVGPKETTANAASAADKNSTAEDMDISRPASPDTTTDI